MEYHSSNGSAWYITFYKRKCTSEIKKLALTKHLALKTLHDENNRQKKKDPEYIGFFVIKL